jgi:hypothetical protein
MAVVEISRIQVRRGQENQTGIPTLAGGEFGWAADTENLYIGLRRDDGGARDANVRVLTENDLFQVVTTTDLAYTYRSDTNPAITAPTFNGIPVERPINKKSDDIVSIKDFGVEGVGGDEVASALIQVAVDNLFLDPLKDVSDYGKHSAKVLYFPAGTYNIDTAIFIPRYTTIVGEGPDKTIINLISNTSHAFQTIDSDPGNAFPGRATFDTYGISSGISQPNYIYIEGLTIQYSTTTDVAQCLSLISLDCADDSTFRNVKFLGNHTPADAATSSYTGIEIRGYAGGLASSNNVLVDRCEFNGLYHDILSNHDILYPVVQNSTFYNSFRGITFNDPKDGAADFGPSGATIKSNVFNDIEAQAFYVGIGDIPQCHISTLNKFYNVGNDGGDETTAAWPVIEFASDSHSSVNDIFSRQIYHDLNIGSVLPYYPLVYGRAALDGVNVRSKTLTTGVMEPIFKLPLTDYSQQLVIKYNIFEGTPGAYTIDKMGTLKIYIQPGSPATTNITDEYTFGAGDCDVLWELDFSPGNGFYVLQCTYTGSSTATFEYQTSLML